MRTTEQIVEMLNVWADWVRRDSNGLGYSSRSVEGRLMDDRGVLPRGTNTENKAIYTPHEADLIEGALRVLRGFEHGRVMYYVIGIHHCYDHQAFADRVQLVGRVLREEKLIDKRLSKDKYAELRNMALAWLWGYFSVRLENKLKKVA